MMTPKQEAALRQALEALETGKNHGVAIDALRRALAEQTAQIPDAFDRLMREADKPTQVPEQFAKYVAAIVQGTHEITSVTIRPKRASKPWVGLTDEERLALAMHENFGSVTDYAEAIEAKLREKNNG